MARQCTAPGPGSIAAMTTFDVDALRTQFPALSLEHQGRPMVFFDGPGGTQVPQRVIDAVGDYYRTSNANHGGAFATSERSDAIDHAAHAAIADLLGADPGEVKFGANMTTLTFHLSRSIAATFATGDEIVVTALDHDANVAPWLAIAADRELVIRTWEPRLDDCTLHLSDLDALLTARTRLVAFGWASNAVGTINPVADIVRRVHEAGAWTYVDAVHAAPHLAIDVRAVDTDFLACSVYKFFGPHLGVVYGKAAILDALPAYKVRPAGDRFETGTGNHEGFAGTLAAVEYLAEVGVTHGGAPATAPRRERVVAALGAIRSYEMALYHRLAAGLSEVDGVRQYGISEPSRFESRTPTAALTVAGVHPRAVAEALGREGIAVWDGDFYATGLIERLDRVETGGVVRIGLTHYNTEAEVDLLLDALARIAASASTSAAGTSPATA